MEQETTEESMIERTEKSFNSRMEDIRILNQLENLKNERENYDLIIDKIQSEYGNKEDYGLSLDFVEAGTFKDQREEYCRFQLSFGGPSEEFRFYANGVVEFWFLDWFKGEHKNLDSSEINDIMSFLGAFDYEELKSFCEQK